jgi:hypothetical protein
MKKIYLIILLFSFTLFGCTILKPDYRKTYPNQPHVIDITLPNFLVPNKEYTYNIYTQPYVKEIQFFWYYGSINKHNLIQRSTLHPLNNKPVNNPYELKWGIESDFLVSFSGNWYLVVVTTDIYGETRLYNKQYIVHSL